ncbi:hypothetical protein ANO11243_015040 [Dothideomycetidae sp. 11243]|nr:hypothetical protein ANO11243_015040 [fungal sp. No.11243]
MRNNAAVGLLQRCLSPVPQKLLPGAGAAACLPSSAAAGTANLILAQIPPSPLHHRLRPNPLRPIVAAALLASGSPSLGRCSALQLRSHIHRPSLSVPVVARDFDEWLKMQ